MIRTFITLFAMVSVVSASPANAQDTRPRILAMGDSMVAWHAISQKSVGDRIAKALGEPVAIRAVGGARIRYALPITGALGLSIPKQFAAAKDSGPFDWVVMNGGGNDLWMGCGCKVCDRRLDKMISADGKTGDIPALVSRIRNTGARVVYLGYLRSPGVYSAVDDCAADGDALEARLANMARADRGVTFVSLTDLVPMNDTSFHALDMVHPSVKGSAAIAARAVAVIRRADKNR